MAPPPIPIATRQGAVGLAMMSGAMPTDLTSTRRLLLTAPLTLTVVAWLAMPVPPAPPVAVAFPPVALASLRAAAAAEAALRAVLMEVPPSANVLTV